MKFELKPYNRNVSDEELLDDLKQVATKLGKSILKIEEYVAHGRFHNTTFNRRFGSWAKALERAGFGSTINFHPKRFPNDALLADLKRVAKKISKGSLSRDEYNEHGQFDSITLMRRFGSWANALEKATLPRQKYDSRKCLSDYDLITDLKRAAEKLSKSGITMDEYDGIGQFNSMTLCRRFGSWPLALKKANLAELRKKKITNEQLLADLKRVAQELHKSSVTTDEYDERGIYSSFTQSHRFGSWFKALEQAGLNKTRNLNWPCLDFVGYQRVSV